MKFRRPHGFSLIELLTVVALMAFLAGVSLPALNSLNTAQTFNSSTTQLSDFLEGAHAAALAKNTFVWVGMENQTNVGVNLIALFAPSGHSDDLSQGTAKILNRKLLLSRVQLATLSPSDLPDANRATNGVAQLLRDGSLGPITLTIGGSQQTFTNLMEISPGGETRIAPTKSAWIELGLVPMAGNKGQKAVLQVNGLTGKVLVFLP